jgi:hypothetical protein
MYFAISRYVVIAPSPKAILELSAGVDLKSILSWKEIYLHYFVIVLNILIFHIACNNYNWLSTVLSPVQAFFTHDGGVTITGRNLKFLKKKKNYGINSLIIFILKIRP